MLMNEIYLDKKSSVIVHHTKGNPSSQNELATFLQELNKLGFIPSQELFNILVEITNAQEMNLSGFYTEVINCLAKKVGAHKKWEPMYPNFPKQVVNMTESELYLNAMIHYFSSYLSDVIGTQTWLPKYVKEDRLPLNEFHELKEIKLGNFEEFNNIFNQIIGSNTSISESDKDILKWFITENKVDYSSLPDIPFKENLSVMVGLIPERIESFCKTATDVLRVAAAMSQQDVSLSEKIKFKRFNKTESKRLLSALNKCSNTAEDMLRNKTSFLRLGEIIHPRKYEKRFPNIAEAYNKLRNGKVETFNSKVEKHFEGKKITDLLNSLKERPGEFARKLNRLLIAFPQDVSSIVSEFESVVDKVATPVLLQVQAFYDNNVGGNSRRSFIIKGNTSKVYVKQYANTKGHNLLGPCISCIIRLCLKKRFASLPPLGKIYIDPELKYQPVPFGARSASKKLKTVTRGSSFPVDMNKTLRLFVWWKNISNSNDQYYNAGRVDIDLAAAFFNKDLEYISDISYYNLKNGFSHHSGDITNAPNGACEFIDIDLKQAAEQYDYLIPSIYSYSGQNFGDIPECFTGWMFRDQPNSGEVFEPQTVDNKIDLISESTAALIAAIDLKNGRLIYLDMSSNKNARHGQGNKSKTQYMLQTLIDIKLKPNLYTLFSLHSSRGIIVDNIEEADTVFSNYKGITPYDINLIASEYMV